ncbi:hypothetical protein OVY01_11275 [Robbsia sp. Bb-Pol-6]|uniref:Uncharacterized protein n=1 Tax=Robbsia betulipollinis TaxID=2981849 RepID=A0ABT3ZMN7_9BURK|nr:hypothetical protein [Robbsia betulipollinis]MCY0387804.1 hypothetical protein [Robbsia betulipollinis]
MKKQLIIAALISFSSVAAFAQASAPAADTPAVTDAAPASGTMAKKKHHHKKHHRMHHGVAASNATPSSAPKP